MICLGTLNNINTGGCARKGTFIFMDKKVKSDGSTASYYELPIGATELQDIISAKDMNAQIGEIFRSCMRYGEVEHSEKLRDAKKMKFYIDSEIDRLIAYGD